MPKTPASISRSRARRRSPLVRRCSCSGGASARDKVALVAPRLHRPADHRRDLRAADHATLVGAPAPERPGRRTRSTTSARRPARARAHPFGVDPIGRDVFAASLLRRAASRCRWRSSPPACRCSSASPSASSPATSAAGSTRVISRMHRRRARVPGPAARPRPRHGLLAAATAASAASSSPACRSSSSSSSLVELAVHRPHHPRPGPVAAREGVRRGGAVARGLEQADHVPRDPAQPGRADHRLRDAVHPGEHPARGGAVVPRRRASSRRRRPGAQMLAEATSIFDTAWWFMFFPGMALLLTVLAFNLVGDGMQDALNPKARVSDDRRTSQVTARQFRIMKGRSMRRSSRAGPCPGALLRRLALGSRRLRRHRQLRRVFRVRATSQRHSCEAARRAAR